MTLPLVSIVIPAYNAAPWLEQAIRSALAQDWPHKEIIVVDDGSGDDTLLIACTFESRGVRVMSQRNQGAGPARNAGLRVARGDYIQYLDADDLLATGKIRSQLTRLRLHPRHVATGTWIRFMRDPARAPFVQQAVFRDLSPREYLRLAGVHGGTVHTASWLLPRAVADAAGEWNDEISRAPNDDAEYFTRIALNCDGLLYCADAVTYHRTVLAGSLSKQRTVQALTARFRTIELITSHLLREETSPECRRLCADHYQRLAYITYPSVPELVLKAQRRAAELGGSRVGPSMGRFGKAVARVTGWRLVARTKHWLWSRSPYPRLKRRWLTLLEKRRPPRRDRYQTRVEADRR